MVKRLAVNEVSVGSIPTPRAKLYVQNYFPDQGEIILFIFIFKQ